VRFVDSLATDLITGKRCCRSRRHARVRIALRWGDPSADPVDELDTSAGSHDLHTKPTWGAHHVGKRVLAGVAVADLDAALPSYERLFGRPADAPPMEGLAEWHVTSGAWPS
jgi:hypothetical protein